MARHVPIVPDPVRRHAKACEEALRRDRAWFQCHRDRCLRIRRSLPYEHEGWDATGHQRLPFMLVHTSPARDVYDRHGVTAKKMPDGDEAFLALLWADFERRRADGGLIEFSPEQHLEMLQSSGVSA